MVLVDYNQMVIAATSIVAKQPDQDQPQLGLVRHLTWNMLRTYKRRHCTGDEEMVLCCDGDNYWRTEFFPYYKAGRKKHQKADPARSTILDNLDVLREELRLNSPYKVLCVPEAEADDIIATLSYWYLSKVTIVSDDHDFGQLQSLPFVSQYMPRQKKYNTIGDPKRFLREHILRGDPGDGVPNFLSDDDTFVAGKRQHPLKAKDMITWIEADEKSFNGCDGTGAFFRNKMMIDLSCMPDRIQFACLNAYQTAIPAPRSGLLNYFMIHRLKDLTAAIGEF